MKHLARTPKQIGNLIRRARRTRDWTQAYLGELAGVRQATISDIETGSSATRLDTLLNVLSALNLELNIGTRTTEPTSKIEDIF